MKSSPIRLFAIDVDGTLLDSSHRLRTEVKDAVCRLAASGVEVALATARSPQAVREIVRQFDFSPWLICFSGAWIAELDAESLEPKHVCLDQRIPASAADFIVATALNNGVEPNVFTPKDWRVRTMTEVIREETRIVDLEPSVTADLLAGNEEPSKIMLISSLERAAETLPRIAESIQRLSTATFSKANYLEVLPAGVNKAKALATLTKSLGMELTEVGAIGDAPNDLEMLREVGLPIAMGNAVPEVKAVANWVVVTNDEAGVAEAVQRLLNEQPQQCSCDS